MTTTETLSAEAIVLAFREALLLTLRETFEHVEGFMLDKGTSFFETLAEITPAEASVAVSSQGASLAAQVNHTRFYLDGILDIARTGEPKKLDWDSSWQVGPVDQAAWDDQIARLRSTYNEVVALAEGFDEWDSFTIGGAIAMVGHSQYHLGEIRAGLAVIRDRAAQQ